MTAMSFRSRLGDADALASLSAMHAGGPVQASPLGVLVVGHAAANAALRDHDTFSSDATGRGGMLAGRMAQGTMLGQSMLSSDPPDHERLRGVVAKAFTPRSVAALEPRVREIADEL